MKWHVPSQPQDGDKRTRRTYAWLPTRCPATGWVFWLMKIEVVERYYTYSRRCGGFWSSTTVTSAE